MNTKKNLKKKSPKKPVGAKPQPVYSDLTQFANEELRKQIYILQKENNKLDKEVADLQDAVDNTCDISDLEISRSDIKNLSKVVEYLETLGVLKNLAYKLTRKSVNADMLMSYISDIIDFMDSDTHKEIDKKVTDSLKDILNTLDNYIN